LTGLNSNFKSATSFELAQFPNAELATPPQLTEATPPPLAANLPDRNARVAIVHDWCPDFRGGERVLARLCALFPNSEVFTLFDFLREDIKEQYFKDVEFHASMANRLPLVQRYYRSLFFMCPFFIEQFDVTGFDAVISSSAAFANGVIARPDQPHLSYVLSPVRYAWDEQFSYLQQGKLDYGPKGMLFRYMLHNLRTWDTRTAHGPDRMVAISSYIQARIKRVYGRKSELVYPPVETDKFTCVTDKDDYYVSASFLAPYKRTDLVILAFNEMPSKRLVVVGEGQQSKALRKLAGPNVTFAGYLPRHEYIRTVAEAKAMVFAGCEDFGIALAEAQACGTPLIAFSRGGARDIVADVLGKSDRPTGLLFKSQTTAAIRDAVEYFESKSSMVTPSACRANSLRFSEKNFDQGILRQFSAVQADHLTI